MAADNPPETYKYFLLFNPSKYVRNPKGIKTRARDCGEPIIPRSNEAGIIITKKEDKSATSLP